MTVKGKKIIADNPDASPHDLLTMHGLSEADFNELTSGAPADDAKKRGRPAKEQSAEQEQQLPSEPEQVAPPKAEQQTRMPAGVQKAQPKTQPLQSHGDDRIYLKDKKTGNMSLFTRKTAENFVRRFPTQYELA